MSLSKKEELILKKIAANMRLDIIKTVGTAGSGHLGGSLSIVEILAVLYFKKAQYDIHDPHWPDRDRVILSKGHCTPGFYTALSYAGFFSRDLLPTFRKFNSDLQGHTDINTLPGVENCGGPLGQGLSVGLGIAIAAKMDGRDYKTYVILGDGECEKGTINEAARLAGIYQMDNLIGLLDHNKIDQDGRVADVAPQNYKQEWESYGWQVYQIDGNSVEKVYETLIKAHSMKNKPVLIILETLKGKGISFMEKATLNGNPQWHGTAPKGELLDKAIKECQDTIAALEKQEKEKTDIFEWIKTTKIIEKEKEERSKHLTPKIQNVVAPEPYTVGEGVATREAFGKYIVALGRADERVVTLTAGVAGSVKYDAFIKEFGAFNAHNRKGRFVQIGIAEANMAGVAAGLAMCNKKPWMATFDIFIKEMLGVIRNSICYANVDVKIVGTHAGLGVEEDGGSHQTLQVPEMMNTMPNITVNEPGDGNETFELMQIMYESNKAGYLRLTRQKLLILQRPYHCKPNVGAYVVKETLKSYAKPNVVIMASGASVSYALHAADELAKEKCTAKVIDVTNIDELEQESFYKLVPDDRCIVTVHDASPNVLGHAVSKALTNLRSKNCSRILSLGIQGFGESGKIPELYAKHGIDVAGIIKACREVMKAQEKMNKEK